MKDSTLELVGRSLVGIGVCTAVGVACKVTESGWPLLGLIFLPSVSTSVTNVIQQTVEVPTAEEA